MGFTQLETCSSELSPTSLLDVSFAEVLKSETCCEHGLNAPESTGGLEQQQLEARVHGFGACVNVGNSAGAVTLQWFTKHLPSCSRTNQ